MRPLKDLVILPGLHTLDTDRGESGRWKDGDKVRFRDGLPEKIGGWSKVGNNTFLGICRALLDWMSLSFEKLIALGTHLKLYVTKGGAYFDITPIRSTGTLGANPFQTFNTETRVRVTHVSHGAIVGDFVTYAGAAAVAGITINGEYQITTFIDVDHYEITHSVAANASTTGGGAAVTYAYQINVGAEHSVYGFGWGAGAYGLSTYGTPRIISTFFATARVWSLDQWGEDLIANPRGKAIYLWDTSVGTGTRAAVIAGAPATARSIMVSPLGQHLIAFGAHTGSADDPLLIRWSDSEDYSVFTAAAGNAAGQKRLNTGSEILGGMKGRAEIVAMTDSNLWAMRYSGPPNTFDFEDMGSNGGLAGANAMIEVEGIVYWMGKKEFYFYDGAVHVLPCDVWPTVFKDVNFVQRVKFCAGYVRDFDEIWWFYCSANATEVDRYVVFARRDKTWAFGTLVRTAIVGDSDRFTLPFATGVNGRLYEHETGVDDDGSAMTSRLASGDVEIGEGDYVMQIGAVVPDFKTLTGSIALSLVGKKFPQDNAPVTKSGLIFTPTTKIVNPRIKARQISLSLSSSALGDNWRIGMMRLGVKPHGKK